MNYHNKIKEEIEGDKEIKTGNINKGLALFLEAGKYYRQHGDPRKALEIYKKITALNPEDTESYFIMGEIYKELGQMEEAISVYSMILRYDLNNIKALEKLAFIWQELGEIRHAILGFKKVLKIDENHRTAKENLEKLYKIKEGH